MHVVLEITEAGAPPDTAESWLRQQVDALQQSAGYAGYHLAVEYPDSPEPEPPIASPESAPTAADETGQKDPEEGNS